MRDYQPTKTPYWLPRELYMMTLYLIRDYDRLRYEYEAQADRSPPPRDGQPRGTGTVDPTERAVLCMMSSRFDKLRAIEQAMLILPDEYRQAVFENVCHREPYPIQGASYATWRRWRQRYIYQVAKNMFWI